MKILKFKNRIIGIGVSLVVLASFTLAIVVGAVYKINDANQFSEFAESFSKNVYKCDLDTKRFFLNIYIDHKKNEKSSIKTDTKAIFDDLKIALNKEEIKKDIVIEKQEITKSLAEIETALAEIETCYEMRGFKETGFEGNMRNAIHTLEDKLPENDMALLLTLRRHEKDFFLRKDTSYVEKFNKTLEKFNSKLNNNPDLLKNLALYNVYFQKIVAIEKQIGLKQNAGLQGILYKNYEEIENICAKILAHAKLKKELAWEFLILASVVLIALILGLIALSVLALRFFNSQIVDPSIKLTKLTQNLADGNLGVSLKEIENKTFLEDIVSSFKTIITNYKSNFDILEYIIKDQNASKLEARSNNDLVSIKLNELHDIISNQRKTQDQRTWFDTGLNQISEILYQNASNTELAQFITNFLVKYLNANQGAIYIKDFEASEIEYVQLGTYAYGRKKYDSTRIKLSEGLVGQCVYEKDVIYMNDVPKNYVRITSGLGESTPRCVAIVPFVQNNEVVAAFEICSFKEISAFEISFLKACGKNIASAILHQNISNKANKMVEESKTNLTVLVNQTEEMRQNLEEMHAIQEDYDRKEINYKLEIDTIKTEYSTDKEQLIQLIEEYKTKNEHQSLQNTHLHTQFEKDKKVFVAKIQEMQRVIYKNHLSGVKESKEMDWVEKPVQKKYPRSIEFYLDA